MTEIIKKIFVPTANVEIALNLNSLAPYAASSVIHDTHHESKTIILAQPLYPITSSTPFSEIHITKTVKTKNGINRYGIKCSKITFIEDYRLFDKSKVRVINVEYVPQLIETNIRSAYRMPMSKNYTVKAKLIHKKMDYYSIKDFLIRDVSVTGLGIIVPLKIGKKRNPLTLLTVSTSAIMGMLLMAQNSKKPIATIQMEIKIARMDQNYTEDSIFIGIKFIGLSQKKEEILNSFIHAAQLDELRRLSRLEQ